MKYEGPIYGVGRNRNGRKIYFDTGRTSQEWDAMEAKIKKLELENAALRDALDAQMQYQRDLRADRDRLDWMESLNQLPVRDRGKWVGWDNKVYLSLRETIDAARDHHVFDEKKEAQP